MNNHPTTTLKDRNITYSTRSGQIARFIVDGLTIRTVPFKFSCSGVGDDVLYDIITARALDLQEVVSEVQRLQIQTINQL